jgi:hypothetical protein
VQEAGHPQEIEKTEEKGESLPVDLVKLAEIAISPVLGKGLAGPSRNSLTPISLSSPVFSEIQLVTRLHYSSSAFRWAYQLILRIMETPIEVSTSK